MISKLARLNTALVLTFGAALGAVGCKSRDAAESSAATRSSGAPEPSAAPSEAVTTDGACAEYARKICDKAGAESYICSEFQLATALMPSSACAAGLEKIDESLVKLAARGKDCEALRQTLCESVGPNTKTCEMVTMQTGQSSPESCRGMLGRLPEITANLQQLEAANRPLSVELQAEIAQGALPSFGPADAKVIIVEFTDFECPDCSRAAAVVQKIREKYGRQVRFVFRQYPLPLNPNSREAAAASLAAFEQGKFWEFHDELFEHQQQLDRAGLEQHAERIGLDVPKLQRSLDQKTYSDRVEADVALGLKVQVLAPPVLFINGRRAESPTDFQAVASMVDQALKGAPPR